MRLDYHLLDVFTDRRFGGNALAVFPEAPPLEEDTMQAIARELNLSETVFVRPAEAGGLRRLRIFTPAYEMPFAGHPTVGSAALLAALGIAPTNAEFVLEVGLGPLPARVTMEDGRLYARFTAPRLPERRDAVPPREEIAALIGLDAADLAPEPAAVVATGLAFLAVVVKDLDALGRVQLDLAGWKRYERESGVPFLYAVVHTGPRRLRVRMFAPAYGIAEDAATGLAACSYAAVLAGLAKTRDGTEAWTLEQGVEMGRPSRLDLEIELAGGKLAAVHLGGHAVRMGEGRLELEAA